MPIIDNIGSLNEVPDKFPMLPLGFGTFKVDKVEVKPNKDQSGHNLVVESHYLGSDGPIPAKEIYLSLNDKTGSKIGRRRFFLSCGFTDKDFEQWKVTGFDSDQLIGKQFRAAIKPSSYKDAAGVQKESRELEILIPSDAGYMPG